MDGRSQRKRQTWSLEDVRAVATTRHGLGHEIMEHLCFLGVPRLLGGHVDEAELFHRDARGLDGSLDRGGGSRGGLVLV